MLLQEIIRNIFLYNGLIEPWIKSVKEDRTLRKKKVVYPEANSSIKVSLVPLISATGTRTITKRNIHSLYYFKTEKANMTENSASIGNNIISMLATENIAELGKNSFSTSVSSINLLNDSYSAMSVTTTGFFIENTQLFFSHETHEKREYLGEFSLLHEENLLNSFIERR